MTPVILFMAFVGASADCCSCIKGGGGEACADSQCSGMSSACKTCVKGGGGSGCISDGRCSCGGPSPPSPSPSGCASMTSISASQLQCAFSQLTSSKASTYAQALSSHLGGTGTLTNKCHWAAFLGNVGTESAGMTAWEEIGCYSTYPDGFCGRGPLQITGKSNYAYCARASDCSGCSGITGDPTIASKNTDVGMETARCVWHSLSGSTLSRHSDGSLNGFKTASICINCGCGSCSTPNGWSSRQQYWSKANSCLGVSIAFNANTTDMDVV